jgi:hypothetical protein
MKMVYNPDQFVIFAAVLPRRGPLTATLASNPGPGKRRRRK